jgi:hypothetical protein
MPDEKIIGAILANELLDNLPFRLFVFDGSWTESFVSQFSGGQFVEMLRIPDVVPVVYTENCATWLTCTRSRCRSIMGAGQFGKDQ